MKRHLFLLIIALFFCAIPSYAQPRPKIDRSQSNTTSKSQQTKPKSGTSNTNSNKTSHDVLPASNTTRSESNSANLPRLTITPQSVMIDAKGGEYAFTVKGEKWRIGTSTASWGHLRILNDQLILEVDPNENFTERTDYFTITSEDTTLRVNIKQRMKNSRLELSSYSLQFTAEGGTQTITVSGSETWKVDVGTASWGHLTKNVNQLTLQIDKNNTTNTRTDYFTIRDGDSVKRVNIRQTGEQQVASATIHKVEVVKDVIVNYKKGLSVKVSFNISNMKDKDARVVCYFYDVDGNALIDKNNRYKTTDGHVSSGEDIKPKYDNSSYTDLEVKIPYDELHLTGPINTRTLRVDVIVWDQSSDPHKELARKDKTSFTCVPDITSIVAEIHSVTVEEDVDVDDKKGLGVKVTFDVSGMKGKEGAVSCYFYDASHKALLDLNDTYGTTGTPSHVACSKNITPSYDNTSYTDLMVKIPYDELHLTGTATRDLQVDVVIWDKSVSPSREIIKKSYTRFSCTPTFLTVDGSSSNKTKSFSDAGGSKYFSVNTSASNYETWGVPSWCRVEDKSSSGFRLVCERNTASSERKDYMKVKAAGKEVRIDIQQDAVSGPTAEITSIEQVHNVYRNGSKGMEIKLKYTVDGMKGRSVTATAWFYYGDNTTRLNNTSGGQVRTSYSDTSPYESTIFTTTLFLPYTQLNMSSGWKGTLSFDVVISDSSGNQLVRKNNNLFTFTNGY